VWFLKARAKGWPFGLWLLVGPGSGAASRGGWDFDRGFGVLLGLVLLRLLAYSSSTSSTYTPLKKENRPLTSRNKKYSLKKKVETKSEQFPCSLIALKIFTTARCV